MFNQIMANALQPEPVIGDGATILHFSDRRAATIVAVTKNTITVQEDLATRIDNNGMSEMQEYKYDRNLNGPVWVFRKTKTGYKSSGRGLLIGQRCEYFDYAF